MKTVRKEDVPAGFAAIDGEDYLSGAGRVCDRGKETKVVRSHMSDGKAVAIEQQAHLNFR